MFRPEVKGKFDLIEGEQQEKNLWGPYFENGVELLEWDPVKRVGKLVYRGEKGRKYLSFGEKMWRWITRIVVAEGRVVGHFLVEAARGTRTSGAKLNKTLWDWWEGEPAAFSVESDPEWISSEEAQPKKLFELPEVQKSNTFLQLLPAFLGGKVEEEEVVVEEPEKGEESEGGVVTKRVILAEESEVFVPSSQEGLKPFKRDRNYDVVSSESVSSDIVSNGILNFE